MKIKKERKWKKMNTSGEAAESIIRMSLQGVEVVAINDPFITPDYAAYLLKYDSIHGRCNAVIKATETGLVVNGKEIKFYQQLCPRIYQPF